MSGPTCRSCGRNLGTADVDSRLQAARCPGCGALTDLAGRMKRAPVPVPERFQVEEGAGLRIRWRWKSGVTWFLLFLAGFWDLALLLTFVAPYLEGAEGRSPLPTVAIGLLVGAGFTYAAVASLVNSTTVEADSGELRLRRGPIPWPGNVRLPASGLDQLYCQEKRSHTRQGEQITYQVQVKDHSGACRKLVGGFSEPEAALFLEQKLESYLGITDRPVPGEFPR